MLYDGPGPTFAEAFATALERRRMTLSRLRDVLSSRGHPISLAALSYWRSGQREPERMTSLEAIPEIEAILGLPAGELAACLAGRERRAAITPFNELMHDPTPEVVRGEVDLSRISQHMVVEVDENGEVTRTRVRTLLVAERDGVRGMTQFVGPDDSPEDALVVTGVAGCTVAPDHQVVDGIRGYAVTFDRPLAQGESTLIELDFRTTGPDHERDHGTVAEQRLEDVVVWVRFHPDKVPSQCWLYFKEAGVDHRWEVDLTHSSQVHYRQTQFGPGVLGVCWEW